MRLLLVCCALLASAGTSVSFGATGDEAPPRLHVVRVNESSPEALAGAGAFAQAAAESCRLAMHLPGPGVAAPVALVARGVRITDGCGARITARSGADISSVGPSGVAAGVPETQVEATGVSGDAWARQRRPLDASGLAADVAGDGTSCVWRSRLMAARFGALAKSAPAAGNGPSGKGLDARLYQALPHDASAHSAGEDVVLRTHASAPPAPVREAQVPVTGGHLVFESNTRLKSLEVGGAAAAKFDKAAADAFVRLPARETL